MKLIRFGAAGAEKPGVLLASGERIDASDCAGDWNEAFFQADRLSELKDWVDEHGDKAPRVAPEVRWGSAVARPSKIICIGLNFSDHAKESGMKAPEEPVVFFKATSALSGPYDPVIIPRGSTKLDWEVELAVVIGRTAKYVSTEAADSYIAGYVLHNDYSERAFQLEQGGQWVKGKSADSFAPLGPFLATTDEIADPNQLPMWLTVNGETMQDGTTANYLFPVQEVIAYLSNFMTLLPGDVISTGTPAGVGAGMTPPRFLQAGDVVELGIEGLGCAKQTVITESCS